MNNKITDINFNEGYDSREYSYSQGILVTDASLTLYISGQVGIHEEGEERTFKDQIDLAYENLEMVLKKAGMTFDNIVKVTELVVGNSSEKLQMVNAKKKQIFKNHYPASTYIPVESLALKGMKFEIDAIAVK